jgi:hypothetical protein
MDKKLEALRQAFENWTHAEGYRKPKTDDHEAYKYERDVNGKYTWPTVHWAWLEWQVCYEFMHRQFTEKVKDEKPTTHQAATETEVLAAQ